jgi:hypothetical protein
MPLEPRLIPCVLISIFFMSTVRILKILVWEDNDAVTYDPLRIWDYVTSPYLMAFSTLMRSSSVMFCWRQLQTRPFEFSAAGDTNVTDAQSRDVGCLSVVTSAYVLLSSISCCVNLLFCHPAIETYNYWHCNVSLLLWSVNPHRIMTIMKPVREAKTRSGLQSHWWW